MSQPSIVRENAILPFTAGQDLTGLEGHALMIDGATGTLWKMEDPDTYSPFAVLLRGGKAGETISVAMCSGGLSGTVRLKLDSAVDPGDLLQVDTSDGTFAKRQTGVGRWTTAQALEGGVAGEKIEAILFRPTYNIT